MLMPEQYFIIYLFSMLLCTNKSIRVLSTFCFLSYVSNELFAYVFAGNLLEYIITSYVSEIILLIIVVPMIQNVKLRTIFILSYLITMINPAVLTLAVFGYRLDHNIATYLIPACINISRLLNEEVVTLILYYDRAEHSVRALFIRYMIIISYVVRTLMCGF